MGKADKDPNKVGGGACRGGASAQPRGAREARAGGAVGPGRGAQARRVRKGAGGAAQPGRAGKGRGTQGGFGGPRAQGERAAQAGARAVSHGRGAAQAGRGEGGEGVRGPGAAAPRTQEQRRLTGGVCALACAVCALACVLALARDALARGLTVVCRHVVSPPQPKRALSAFMCFSKETRPKVIAENPGLAFGDIGKQIGELWRNLSEEDKERYTEAMESYEPAKPEKKSSRK